MANASLGNLFSAGLEFVEVGPVQLNVEICQSDPAGPTFTLHCVPLAATEFERLQMGYDRRRAQAQGASEDVLLAMEHEHYGQQCDLIVKGWSGATIPNLNAVLSLPQGKLIGGAKAAELRASGHEEPFSPALARFVYINSWPSMVRNRVFQKVIDANRALDAMVASGKVVSATS